jgi:hypothetical protein
MKTSKRREKSNKNIEKSKNWRETYRLRMSTRSRRVSLLLSSRRKVMARLQFSRVKMARSIRRNSQKTDRVRSKSGLRNRRTQMSRRLMISKRIINQISLMIRKLLSSSLPSNIMLRHLKMKMIAKNFWRKHQMLRKKRSFPRKDLVLRKVHKRVLRSNKRVLLRSKMRFRLSSTINKNKLSNLSSRVSLSISQRLLLTRLAHTHNLTSSRLILFPIQLEYRVCPHSSQVWLCLDRLVTTSRVLRWSSRCLCSSTSGSNISCSSSNNRFRWCISSCRTWWAPSRLRVVPKVQLPLSLIRATLTSITCNHQLDWTHSSCLSNNTILLATMPCLHLQPIIKCLSLCIKCHSCHQPILIHHNSRTWDQEEIRVKVEEEVVFCKLK